MWEHKCFFQYFNAVGWVTGKTFTCKKDPEIPLWNYYYYYIRLTTTTSVSWHQKGKPFWILLEQGMIGWQWHQLDHMQIICTSLQTDNHASTSSLSFYRPDALPAAQPTVSKH